MSEPIVRAKFIVTSHTIYGRATTNVLITMNAVYDDNTEENKRFYQWTPSGTFSMTTSNENVVKNMQPGSVFYLDFTPEG